MSGSPSSRVVLGTFWPLLPAVLVVTTVVGALTVPLVSAAAAIATALVVLCLRWPRATSLTAMVAGPVFLSGYSAGPVTLDNVTVLLGAALGTGWLLLARRRGTPLVLWPAFVAVAISLAAAANGGAGLAGVARFASLAVLVLLLANCDAAAVRRATAWTEAAVTLGALVLIAQPFTGYPSAFGTAEGVGQRFGGLFGHPNFAAYTVCLVLLFQIYVKNFTRMRTASAGILLLALVLTGSRAALIVFALLLLPALWLRMRRFFGLLVPAVLALPFVGTTIVTRLESIVATGGLTGENASGWRLGQWAQALAATRGHEYFGIGWGRTAEVMADNLGAHSAYVQSWLEFGRVGTAVIAVGAILLAASLRSSRPAMIMLAYVLVTSISDPVILYPSCLTVFLLLVSCLLRPDCTEPEEAPRPGIPASEVVRPPGRDVLPLSPTRTSPVGALP
jgi:O-antigen ligase